MRWLINFSFEFLSVLFFFRILLNITLLLTLAKKQRMVITSSNGTVLLPDSWIRAAITYKRNKAEFIIDVGTSL